MLLFFFSFSANRLFKYDSGQSDFRSGPYKYVSRTTPAGTPRRSKLGFQPMDLHDFKTYWSQDLSNTDHPTNFVRGRVAGRGRYCQKVVAQGRRRGVGHSLVLEGSVLAVRGVEIGWLVYGRTKDGLYVSLEANCEYTGFDIGGGLRFYVSKDSPKVWLQAFTDKQRREMEAAGVARTVPDAEIVDLPT
jgi:hypothetical protein